MLNAFGSCRSPNESKHRLLYKASTPPWKETYRKRCQERLAVNRQNFLERYRLKDQPFNDEEARKAIHDLVLTEWPAFENDIKRSNSQNSDMVANLSTEDVDEVLSIFDEITQELLQEEQQIIAEYETSIRLDEASLCASIEHLTANEVICPVCQRSPLFINKGIVFCNCGIRIDTEQDAITLDMIRANLREASHQHSLSCECSPSFGVVSHVGINNMLMTCESCDFMFIII